MPLVSNLERNKISQQANFFFMKRVSYHMISPFRPTNKYVAVNRFIIVLPFTLKFFNIHLFKIRKFSLKIFLSKKINNNKFNGNDKKVKFNKVKKKLLLRKKKKKKLLLSLTLMNQVRETIYYIPTCIALL